jgi:hypothetical protein
MHREDVKNLMSAAVLALLVNLKRSAADHVHICGDGHELLFVDAAKFSVVSASYALPGDCSYRKTSCR